MHRRQKGIFKITTTALLVVFLSYFIPAFAARAAVGVPEEVTYQGRLLDGSGNLLGGSSGTDYCFKFSFFDDETVGGGDAQLWPAGAPSTMTIEVTEGVFTAGIGDVGAGGDLLDFNFQSTDEAYLNVEVGDQVAGSCALAVFENLSPRQRIRSSGYAINAGTLEGMGAADFLASAGDTATGDFDFSGASLQTGSPLVFEGATADAFETTFAMTDPTADRTITFQDASGTVAFLSDIAGSQNLFETIATTSGTAPVADSATDTLSLSAGSANITVTGDSITDTVTLDIADSYLFNTGDVATGNYDFSGAVFFGAAPWVLEGATADTFELTLALVDPTADQTITFPDVTGTVVTTGDTGSVTGAMIANGSVDISNDTNLSNGTNTTVNGDSIDVNDVFLMNTGDTGTGDYDFTGAVLQGASPLVFEGGTVDAFESTFAFADPTSDRTITFQNASGTVAFLSDIGTNLWEDGAMGVFEDDKAVIVGTDVAFSFASGGIGDLRVADEIEVIGNAYIGSDAADTVTLNATILGGSPFVFEGATANAFETTLAITDPTADRVITVPDVTGTVVTTGDAGSVTGTMIANGSVDISDDTNLSNGTNTTVSGDSVNVNDVFLFNTGDTGTGNYDFTGAVYLGASPLVFEGGTVDAFESTFAFADPTADRTITFQNASGTVAFLSDIGTNLWEDGAMGVFEDDKAVIVGTDVAFSFASGGIGDLRVADEIEVIGNAYIGSDAADTVTFNATVLGGSPLVFEGATVDAFETTFAVADPTADRTITFPNASGTVAVSATSPVTLSAAGDIGCATCLTSGGVAFTITDGTTPQTISNGDTMTFVDGTDINVVTSATDTVTVNNTSTLASVTGRGATTAALVNLDGGMAVDTSNFTVSGTTGDVLTAGDLTVNGNTAIGNAASDIFTITATIGGGTTPLTFEGAVADANETTFAFIEPTADRTITFKDGSGTVAFTSDITGSAWSVGANGLFYNTAAVIVGSDSAFSYASGGAGDLRVADELEVIGQAQFGDGIRFRSSTPTWQFVDAGLLAWSDGTNNLLQARDINTNFGLAMNAGAFIDRNSKIEEEFSKKRTTITVDTTGASGTGLGDGGGWGAYENANCTFTSTNDAINGIVNIANTGSGNGCLLMMDDALNNARSVLDADNLPVMLMKLRPNNTGANFYAYAGMADSTDGLTAAPTNFIGFSTEGSTTWAGVTISGGTQTTVACAGQTVSTSQYALMMVEVRSTSDVHFFIDPDVSDGVAFTECDGGSSTNIPTISLAPMFHWQSRSGGASGSMDVDFFRAWQDDNEQTPEAAVADAATPEGAPADAEDLTPAQTDLGIDGMKESWELKKVTADFSTGSAMTQMFPSDNTEIPEGTIVSLTGEGPKVEPSKLAADDLMVGVVTKTSGVEVSNGTFDGVRVAITGRVSVRASAANGIIHVGDYLTSSGKNGVAVKAGVGSPIIGRAMSEYDGEGEGNVVLFLSASAPWGGTSALVSSATEAEGSLVVSGSLLLGGGLELDQVGSATSPETIVYGDLLFGKAAANIDTAGFAAVAQGQRSVRVDFAEPYLHDPSVNITLSLESGDMGMDSIFGSGLRYIVTNKSKLGFNISIDVDAPQELNFSWIALAVKDGNISRNNGITNGRAPSAEADPVHRTEPEAESVPAEAETSGFEEPLSSEDEAEVPPSEEPGSSSAEQDPAQEEPTPIEPAPDAATTDDAAEVVPVVEDVPVAVPVIEAPPTPAPEAPAPEEAPAELVAP